MSAASIMKRPGDILERRDDFAILLNEHSVFKSVGGLWGK
jgi:hypothetical protein